MRRVPLTATLLIFAMLFMMGAASARGSGPPLAQAPADTGVGDLWDEFPLEDGSPVPGGQGGGLTDADGRVKPRAQPKSETLQTPTTKVPAPTVSPSPAQAPAAQATGNGGGDDGRSLSSIWIVLLIVLLLVVDILIFLRVRRARRRRQRESAYPVWGHSSNVYAEGSTDRDEIGAFQGFVYAMGSDSGTEADRMLCVHDPSRDEPIWVRRSEVTSLSSGSITRPSDRAGQASSKPAARLSPG